MFRRQLTCPGCGDDWPSPPARFCGRCGEPLDVTSGPRRSTSGTTEPNGRWSPIRSFGVRRVALVCTAALVIASVATAAFRGVEFEQAGGPDGSVELPDELGAPARLSDEQRDALAGFDPERLHCDPAGCEAWRFRFDTAPTRLTVQNGWFAAIDGTVLHLRRLTDDAEAAGADPSEAPNGATDEPPRNGPTPAPDDTTGEAPRVGARFERTSTSELTGGSGWGPTPSSPPAAQPTAGEHHHDLAGRFAALEWHDDHDGAGYLDVAATPPEQLVVLAEGDTLLRWYDRLVLLTRDGDLRWEVTSNRRTFRYIDVVDDRLLVLRDDLPWPQGTTGPRPTGDPILASVHDLRDGSETWQRYTLSPRDVMAGGLLITTVDGGIEMVDLDDGTTRWRRPLHGSERIQSTTGPWVVVTSGEGATLLEATTGVEVARREGAALLTPLHRIGDVWVAAWLDGGLADGAARAAIIALDDTGDQRWQASIVGLGGGACCPAAIPWAEGTIAVHDPASPVAAWRTLDRGSGAAVDLAPDLQPQLPLAQDDPSRIFVSSLALDRLVQQQEGRIGLLTVDGQVRVHGSSDLEVVSLDPLVVHQGTEVLGVRPVPPASTR
jgi:hypothetical protein